MSDPMSRSQYHVLLVDDDPATLRLLSQWLHKAGYRLTEARDGQQALAAIEEECPDFLITDWEMPQMSGLELCETVRRMNLPHYVYIVFLTLKASSHKKIAGLEGGADDFLTKPIERKELLAQLRSGVRVLELERRLSQMARTDPLTGLSTRRTFYDCLVKEWERSKRIGLPLSCVMIDIDFFKRINDIHGHPAGDVVLKAVTNLLNETCRNSDSLCRHGGEEFCVMLPETNEQGAAVWAERVRKRLGSLMIPVGDKELRVTASFGAAQKYGDTQTPEDLVDQADQALLCAKQSGRDRVVCFEALSHAGGLGLDGSEEHGGLFEGISARHVMTPLVACLREDQTVAHATEYFLRSRINSTPVVDVQGRLTGILSEKDLMAAMVSLECWRRPVREVMKPNVICYEEKTPIRTIYDFLCRVSIRRVVIVDDGRPTGAISRGTLLRWCRNLVISKGLLDSEEIARGEPELPPHRSKERLAETARELARQASLLQDRFGQDADDLVPYVVGGATQMQELVNDLLAYSLYANETADGAAAVQSMLLSTSHTD
jgi:two-component system cell cycle response regulator